jgi:hypothetical protein
MEKELLDKEIVVVVELMRQQIMEQLVELGYQAQLRDQQLLVLEVVAEILIKARVGLVGLVAVEVLLELAM